MGFFSCDYLKTEGTLFSSYYCTLTMQKVENSTATNVCLSSKHTDCYQYKKKNSWFFIANAAYKKLGFPEDDFGEFAAWKCRALCSSERGRAFLKDYNDGGPKIVDAINKRPDSKAIYEDIYKNTLRPCLELIKAGEAAEAFNLYKAFYEQCKSLYLE